MNDLLTYALKDGVLVHVMDVPNGLACNAFCPNCKEPLIARANNKNGNFRKTAHFSHASGSECSGAIESAIHLLAKQILVHNKCIQLPDFHFDYDQENLESKIKSFNRILFDEALEEVPLKSNDDSIIVDILAKVNGLNLIIEFANTHFVDEKKRNKIKNLGIPCIEINLKGLSLDYDAISTFLLSKTSLIYWIYNPKQENLYLCYLDERKKAHELEQQRELDGFKQDQRSYIAIVNGRVRQCPKKINFSSYFKRSEYYSHPILKRISDGEFWNKRFYGHYATEEYIYVGSEKIYTSIYPQVNSYDERMSLLRKGLKQIQGRNCLEVRLCGFCKFSENEIRIEGKSFQICNFKLDAGPIKDFQIE